MAAGSRNVAVPRMSPMSAGSKLSMALVAVLLAIGLAACGGDDDSDTTATTDAAAAQNRQGEGGDDGNAKGDDASNGDAAESGPASSEGEGSDGGGEGRGGDAIQSKDFVPRQYDDSGGGSDPYVVQGGDNSVQEFGTEADETERNATATVLHNFLDARAQEAWDAACSYLSGDVRQSLEMFAEKAKEAAEKQGESIPQDTSCPTILAGLTNKTALPELRKEAAEVDVRSFRAEGDRGFVIYTVGGGVVMAISVVKEDGDWKVGSLAGTPIVY
jgi:hypothetical protein